MIILLAMFSAWEEIQQLIQRGSWDKKDFWIPTWDTQWNGIFKLFDSHHIAFGAFILIMFYIIEHPPSLILGLGSSLPFWLGLLFYWVIFFYIRDLFMHIIFTKKRRWAYIVPLFGGLIEKFFKLKVN